MTTVQLTATFTTPGNWSWTAPPGVTSVQVLTTGGGGGGGAAQSNSAGSNGGGGGGGETAYESAVAVTPGLSYPVVVGGGGVAGTQGNPGGSGGAATFTGDNKFLVIGNGGGGGGSAPVGASGPLGIGGSGSQNSLVAGGGNGDEGLSASNGGGGGGAGGMGPPGAALFGSLAPYPGGSASGSAAGTGGAQGVPGALLVGGSGGAGSLVGTGPGGSGNAPGGGGGGALSTGVAGRAGGPGSPAQVVIIWTMTDPVTLVNNTAGATVQFQAPLGASTVTAKAWGAGGGGYDIAPSGGALAGASVFAPQYGVPKWTVGANTFDGRVGRQMAHSVQKVYYIEEQYPSASNDPQSVAQMAGQGIKLFIMFMCSRRAVVAGGSTLASQQSQFAAAIAYLQSIPNINFSVALGNEPNVFGQHGPFGDGTVKDWNLPTPYANLPLTQTQVVANYAAYSAAYAPICAAAGIKVAYNPAAGAAPVYAQAMFPGLGSANGGCDLIMADFYSGDFFNGTNLFGAGTMEAVADTYGIPFGMGEYGQSKTMANSYWGGTFIPMFLTGFQNRFSANKKVGDVIFFGGDNAGASNFIASNTDYHIPGLQQVFDLFNSQSSGQAGGAGGGGGEYASEASLAVTGLLSYTIVVGAGGNRASGTNSTIAGDSVTVTAHGGSVATTVGTGGAGGTGSGNSTHEPGGQGGAGGITNGGGGGGGGSGGTSAAGNVGNPGHATTKGAGAVAVAGGGPGGDGGGPNGNGTLPLTGPGGGGGARGASGQTNGIGADGQITLSGFSIHPAGTGGLSLAGLGFAGTGGTPSGAIGLGSLSMSGTANVCDFNQVQSAATVVGTGNGTVTLTCAATQINNMIKAVVISGSTNPFSAPAGWIFVNGQNAGGGAGRVEVWYYPSNPGGVTSALFTAGPTDTLRGFLSEYSTPAGTSQAVDQTAANSGVGPIASFSVATLSANIGGDLGNAVFANKFSSGTAGTWGTPSSSNATYSNERSQAGAAVWYYSAISCGLQPATQSVTQTASTSTNETGWAAIYTAFKVVFANLCTGSLNLAGLGFSAAGQAVIGPTQNVCTGGIALGGLSFQSPSTANAFPNSGVLPILVEILLNGTWTDITEFVYQRDAINIQPRGRPNEASTAQAAICSFTLNNRNGAFTVGNTNSPYYPYLVRNTQIRFSVVNAVTSQGAWYTGYRFWGEVPAWPVVWDPSGTDIYITVAAAGVLQRLRQSATAGSPLRRYYQNIINNAASPGSPASALVPVGYWPCEDGEASLQFSSGLTGGSPMTWSGGISPSFAPSLGGDSNVAGSDAFAVTNSTTWTGTPGVFNQGGVTFSNPGTYQWICPAGITTIKVECWGAGGGGANGQGGGAAGGGEYAQEPNLAVTPGKTYTLVVGAGGQGGGGSFSTRGVSGQPGGKTTFVGDVITVVANGGQGGNGNGSSNASGGTGSHNSIHFHGGQGSGGGSGDGGAGGGSSAGNGANGNNGHGESGTNPGAGGSALPGGGPGGTGGIGATASQGNQATPGMTPFPGPGGGGGGGGFNGYNDYGKPGGNGQAGQVTISFGTTPIPPANVLRALVDVASGGGVDGSYLLQGLTNGTVASLSIQYKTAGSGSLALIGKNAGGSTIINSAVTSFAINNNPMIVSAELTQNTPTQIAWKLTAIQGNATAPVATVKGTVNGTLGSVTSVKVNDAAGFTDTGSGIGHITVQYAVDPITNLAPALAGYAGELAGTRFLRLCAEQHIPVMLVGNASDTPAMGPQTDDLLINLLQDCENTDLGLMYEPRTQFGLAYATRVSLQNQVVACQADYSQAHLSPPLLPTNDEVLVRNYVQATRTSNFGNQGATYYAIQESGPLSVQDPPNGVGTYAYQVNVNVNTDTQLVGFATWVLLVGTLDEYRFPQITFDLTRPECQGNIFNAVASLDIGSFLQIINPPSWLPQNIINQLCFGFAETLNAKTWTITVNAVPEDPYSQVGSNPLPTW